MRFGFTINTPELDEDLLAWKGDTREVCAALKDIGYEGVEPFVRDPSAFDVERFAEVIHSEGLTAVSIGTSPMEVFDGLSLSDPDDSIRDTTINRLKGVIRMAQVLKCPVSIAKVRGSVSEDPDLRIFRRDEAVRALGDYAGERDVTLIIEPIKHGSMDNLNTVQETLAWLKTMSLQNLKLLLDSFHMQSTEAIPHESLLSARDELAHVHFADSGRAAPGMGAIDFLPQLKALQEIQYKGFITMEIKQTPDSPTAAKDSIQHIRSLLSGMANPTT